MDDDAMLLRRFVDARSEPNFRAFVERRFNFVYTAALRGESDRADGVGPIIVESVED